MATELAIEPAEDPFETPALDDNAGAIEARAPEESEANIDRVSKGLGEIKKGQNDTLERVATQQLNTLNQDQARLAQQYKKVGVEADNLKPWDADLEQKKRQTDPIAAFGSLGSVFGILASAFTRAPMETALNASAAAINAIKEGNEKDYTRSYQAWQDNNKLALERHRIQHDAYQDATSLLTTNMAAGDAKMRVLAARFGDRQTQFLLENGMSKEVIELQSSRDDLANKLALNAPKVAVANAQQAFLMSPESGFDFKNPTSQQSQKAVQRMNQLFGGQKYDEDLDFATRWNTENPSGTSAEFAKAFGDYKRTSSGVLTQGRLEASAIAQRASEIQAAAAAAGKTITPSQAYEQATKEVKLNTSVPTGNRMDDLSGKLDRIVNMESTIGKVEALMKKHGMITGLGGTITRPAEVVGNIFGSNDTDRKQFERYIKELQDWAPAALNDRGGRPLAAEVDKINTIIAGLKPGDTVQNTTRAYKELRELLYNMKQQLEKRRGAAIQQEGPLPSERKPGGTPEWMRGRVVDE